MRRTWGSSSGQQAVRQQAQRIGEGGRRGGEAAGQLTADAAGSEQMGADHEHGHGQQVQGRGQQAEAAQQQGQLPGRRAGGQHSRQRAEGGSKGKQRN